MQRAMKDAETTAARKRVFFDIRDSAAAAWAGSVTGVKAKRSLSGATVADTTNDIVRVGGALHYVELDNTEAASGAAGDVIACYVPADTGRLESTHGFYEITADDVSAAAITDDSIADEVQTRTIAGVTLVTTTTNLTNAPTSGDLTATMKASVKAEVVDVIRTDTVAELTGVPAANAALSAKINWLFMKARNLITQTATSQIVKADDGTTTVATSTVSDDGTTATRGEFS